MLRAAMCEDEEDSEGYDLSVDMWVFDQLICAALLFERMSSFEVLEFGS